MMMTLGEKIKQLRSNRSWSQRQLAEQLGLQRSTVAQYEIGKIMPSGAVLKRMSALFAISMDELMEDRIPIATDRAAIWRGVQLDGSYVDAILRLSARRISDDLAKGDILVYGYEPDATYRFVEALLRLNYLALKNGQVGVRIEERNQPEQIVQLNEQMPVLLGQILAMEKTYEMFKPLGKDEV